MPTTFRIAITLAASLLLADSAAAQSDYPNRVVKVVNPYVAGSTTDILARALSTGMSSRLGQQFIVENRGGAGGAIGTAQVARSDADGYTLLFAPALVLSVHAQNRDDTGYKPDSLVPVCQTFVNAMALAVKADSPLKTVADLVAAAKSKPGSMNYGHQGPFNIPHLAMEEFLQAANINIQDVPFRGEPLVMTDLIGGRLDVASIVLGSAAGRQDVRVIGVFAESRHPAFANVPTVKEQGYDVAPISFGGLMAPAGTPEPVIARLAQACEGAAKDEAYVRAAKAGGQPDNYYADRKVFAERLARDIAAKDRLLKKMGLAR